jgi:hypothetical protein
MKTPEQAERIAAFLQYLLQELERCHGVQSPVYNQLRGFIEREFKKG